MAEIVRDFRTHFTYTHDPSAKSSQDHDRLSWAPWPPAAAQPRARNHFHQQLDELTEVARCLLAADSVSDEVLRHGTRLLGPTAAELRAQLPRD